MDGYTLLILYAMGAYWISRKAWRETATMWPKLDSEEHATRSAITAVVFGAIWPVTLIIALLISKFPWIADLVARFFRRKGE